MRGGVREEGEGWWGGRFVAPRFIGDATTSNKLGATTSNKLGATTSNKLGAADATVSGGDKEPDAL